MGAALSPATAGRRRSHRDNVKATRAELAYRFPSCFVGSHEIRQKRPLALGITPTLIRLCPDLKAEDIRHAVRAYLGRPSYLRVVVAGAVRVDQNGLPAGRVDADHAALAAGRLRSAEARIAEERAARAGTRSPMQVALDEIETTFATLPARHGSTLPSGSYIEPPL